MAIQGWHSGYRPVAAIGADLDHRLGQFLDKERHPVSSLADLVDSNRGNAVILSTVRSSSPRAVGSIVVDLDLDLVVDEQPARGRIDPMQVFEDQQDRVP